MRRRDFITLLCGAVATWPAGARGQQAAMPVIGFLNGASPGPYAGRVRAFRQGLNYAGLVENSDFEIEYRWAEGHNELLPALAADMVRRQVTVIAAGGRAAVEAAKAATKMTPIVFTTADDPIEAGFVTSLNRPGGNLTGATNLNAEVGPKRLEVLHELLPVATLIGLLVNPTDPNAAEVSRDVQAAADALGLTLRVFNARTGVDFDSVFTTARGLGVAGMVIGADAFFTSRSQEFAALMVSHRIPTIHNSREFVAAGGLISYGGSGTESYRQIGIYAGRILKGEKPAELPVHQSTKMELILNLKTAKALGLNVPLALLGRADEVIE